MPLYSIAEISSNQIFLVQGKNSKNNNDICWADSGVAEKLKRCIIKQFQINFILQNLKLIFKRLVNLKIPKTMDALNYLREYAGGFRMPDLSKIWYGQDEVDAGNNESLLIQVRIIIWFCHLQREGQMRDKLCLTFNIHFLLCRLSIIWSKLKSWPYGLIPRLVQLR